ncbi:MAG TPA: LemA family protein [Bacteroidales bacterium]|nr:LemA family protein [Bacteroidales bacterium]HNW68588.1 LemA family protein [Bacteroidales bacterium]HPT53022.1 LemA family protein [Bacteroidales bacterium]
MSAKKTRNIVIFTIIGLIVISFIYGYSTYNGLTKSDEAVNEAWAQVENVYQRRADLIPQLVSTVKGAADYERSTLENVIKARSEATSIKIDPSNMTQADLAKFQASQDQLSSSLNKLMVVVERYPELKANANFQTLQAQLEGTENRITVERKKFNEATKTFNASIRLFPKNIIAGMFDFEKRPYFEAKAGAENAPSIEFDYSNSNQ